MNKSVIFGLFLMTSLLMGTILNVNMFPTAMADGKDKDDKRYQHDDNNRYQQSTYGNDPYANSYDNSYSYDKQPSYNNDYDKSSYVKNSYGDRYNEHKDKQSPIEKDPYANSYDNSYSYDRQPSYDKGYDKSSYFMDSYGDRDKKHKDKIKDYECRTGPFEGFFVSSVEFCDAKHKKFDDRKNHR